MERKNETKGSLILLFTALIWGTAFIFQSKGMDYMQPLTFNGVRSLIGAFVLLIYILLQRKLQGEKAPKIEWRATILGGVSCGLALALASTLQQYGIKYTTVGKSSFITTLYIIFVPILGLLLGRRPKGKVWIAALIAAVGMYFLCMTESFSLGLGDTLVFLCAIAFAVQIMLVDYFGAKTEGLLIPLFEFAISGILCTAGALIFENPTWGQLSDGLGSLLYAGVLSCGVAYTLQVVAQRLVNPATAALIMSLESVFATTTAVLAYKIGFLTTDQTMTGRQILGCVLVFIAVLLVELPVLEKKKG